LLTKKSRDIFREIMLSNLTPKELKSRLDAGEKFTLLDVRELDEVAYCRLDGAVHMPMHSIPTRVAEIRQLLPVVVYCHHGIRSLQVCHYLEQYGLDYLYNLDGGIEEWAVSVDPALPRY